MRLVFLVACVFFASPASALEQSCVDKFTGFFEWHGMVIPEMPYADQMTIHGRNILSAIQKSTEINPESSIARNGFSGLGKCFAVDMNNARNIGFLTEENFSMALMALHGDKLATYFFSWTDDFISEGCTDYQAEMNQNIQAVIASGNYRGDFKDGYYRQPVENALVPIKRKIMITEDSKFFLSTRYLYRIDNASVYHICAFPRF